MFRVRHLPFRDETFASRSQFGDGDFCLFEDFQTETFADIQIETFAETFFLEHMRHFPSRIPLKFCFKWKFPALRGNNFIACTLKHKGSRRRNVFCILIAQYLPLKAHCLFHSMAPVSRRNIFRSGRIVSFTLKAQYLPLKAHCLFHSESAILSAQGAMSASVQSAMSLTL